MRGARAVVGGVALPEDADEDLLELIVEHFPKVVLVKDAVDLRFVRCNRAAEELLGYRRDELIGMTDHDFFPRHEADLFAAADRRVLADGRPIEIEAEFVPTRTNGRRVLRTTKVPLFGPDGRPRYLLAVSDDITDRYAAERSLAAARLASERANRRLDTLRASLEQVIASGNIEFEFQPIADLASLEHVGAEALARFPLDPDRAPDQWFAFAAECDMSIELEAAVAARALAHADMMPADHFLAVNLSPAALVSRELETVLGGRELGGIVIELTEHSRVEDYELLIAKVAQLREQGARVAVDDAGAGWSTMQHVVMVNPDMIKLDIEITRRIDANPSRRALAHAIVEFATEVGSAVVAEGIETNEELETLRSLGVAYGQGYLLCPPQRLPLPGAPATGR